MWLTKLVILICLVVGEGYAGAPTPPHTRPTRAPSGEPSGQVPTIDASVIPQGGCLDKLTRQPIIQSERRFLVSTKRGENRRALLERFPDTLVSPNTTRISSEAERDIQVAVLSATQAEEVAVSCMSTDAYTIVIVASFK